ncbi:sugar transferase [Gammaproteobacteria bacterium]|jgi:lipopolysaccharide/colanic/teichoic acid biosynthesis glycosyltransferase|nr:sugar transferase [Gammaproteobacteria bacterium]
MQRFFDVILSFMALILLSPLLLPIIIILKFTGEGEIFYIQQRSGLAGKEFGLLKFATMLKNSPNIGAGDITIKSDPRILPFGKLLRKSKINELPQILNILMGHMSVVGPRPMVPNTYANYSPEAQMKLNTVRPGLTGIGSIIFRDEEIFLAGREEPMTFYKENIIPYKSKLEIWFVSNNSMSLYLKVIFVTAWVVIFPLSKIAKKVFKNLPEMPSILKR